MSRSTTPSCTVLLDIPTFWSGTHSHFAKALKVVAPFVNLPLLVDQPHTLLTPAATLTPATLLRHLLSFSKSALDSNNSLIQIFTRELLSFGARESLTEA